jgi:hypothetical protein
MRFLQQAMYAYEIFIWARLRQYDGQDFSSAKRMEKASRTSPALNQSSAPGGFPKGRMGMWTKVMKSLLIAIPALTTVGLAAWAVLVLVILEH